LPISTATPNVEIVTAIPRIWQNASSKPTPIILMERQKRLEAVCLLCLASYRCWLLNISLPEFKKHILIFWYHFDTILLMPRKIKQLIKELEKAGFINRGGKESHRNFIHPKGIPTTISGKIWDDAKPYQEKEVDLKIKRSKK